MTAAYTILNADTPNGTQSPAQFAISALANVRALRDGAVCGFTPGFSYSQNGGTDTAPTNRVWANAVTLVRFRAVCTYGNGTYPYMPTAVKWQWSDDNGGTWADMDAVAATLTWSTTGGTLHITAVDRDAGLWIWALSGMAAAISAHVQSDAHEALTGTAVHGLGTMSTQNKVAVDIDGGTIDATTVGDTSPSRGSFNRVAEMLNTLTPALNAGITVDWSYGFTKVTHNGTNAITFANYPAAPAQGAGHIMDISNLNQITFPGNTDWGLGGKPSIAGRCLVTLVTDDVGTKVFASVGWRAL